MPFVKRVFIVGWYGTETVGDKAILGGILDRYDQFDPPAKIQISSLYPFVTKRTVDELCVKAKVIPVYSHKFVFACAVSDEIVMGGGPLMGMQALFIPLWAFIIAKIFGKKRIIWGCGLGPLKEEKYIQAVKKILLLADEIKLRDGASARWANQLTGRTDILVINDPATDYVLSRQSLLDTKSRKKNRVVSCFLRDWPYEYSSGVNAIDKFYLQKESFEKNLARSLMDVSRKYNLRLVFYPMHSFTVGNDDREFNRKFLSKYLSQVEAECYYKPATVDGIIEAMQDSKLNICMRFHSVLFSHTLGVNYIAIDYTAGGKIKGFLEDKNSLEKCVPLLDIAEGNFNRWNDLVDSYFN